MNESIWQSIAATPWWAVVFVCYFAYLSYIATKPFAIPLRKLMLFPIFIASMSAIGMYALIKPNAAGFACWAVMLMLGTGLGWLQYRIKKVRAIPGEKTIQMPGSWSGMVVLVTAILAKYYFNFQPSSLLNPEIFQQPGSGMALMSLYGLATGLFIGRLLSAQHIVKHGPFIHAIGN